MQAHCELKHASCLSWNCCLGSRCMYLCSVIRLSCLVGWVLSPTGSSVLTQPAYLLQPECSYDSSVETISRMTLLFSLSHRQTRGAEHQHNVFCETKCCRVVGLHWRCFLPIFDFNRFWSRLWRVTGPHVSFSSTAKKLWNYVHSCFPTYHLFIGNLSPVA